MSVACSWTWTRLCSDPACSTVLAAIVGCAASFVGAVVPLLIGAVTKPYSWSALAVSVADLGALGAGLAKAVSGRPLRWVVVMTAMGVLVAYIGVVLDIA